MILRYRVETKFSSTFTASKRVKDEIETTKVLMSLGLLNMKEGYKKYSSPVLYDDSNREVKRYVL